MHRLKYKKEELPTKSQTVLCEFEWEYKVVEISIMKGEPFIGSVFGEYRWEDVLSWQPIEEILHDWQGPDKIPQMKRTKRDLLRFCVKMKMGSILDTMILRHKRG